MIQIRTSDEWVSVGELFTCKRTIIVVVNVVIVVVVQVHVASEGVEPVVDSGLCFGYVGASTDRGGEAGMALFAIVEFNIVEVILAVVASFVPWFSASVHVVGL